MQKLSWKRLQSEKSRNEKQKSDVFLKPVNSSLTKWHFTFYGPSKSDYQKGIYHGVIIVPNSYPYSPPDIALFTRSGRYKINQKICLTTTSFHKEEWSPIWTLQQIIRAFRLSLIHI